MLNPSTSPSEISPYNSEIANYIQTHNEIDAQIKKTGTQSPMNVWADGIFDEVSDFNQNLKGLLWHEVAGVIGALASGYFGFRTPVAYIATTGFSLLALDIRKQNSDDNISLSNVVCSGVGLITNLSICWGAVNCLAGPYDGFAGVGVTFVHIVVAFYVTSLIFDPSTKDTRDECKLD